jgi:hypothetical protein
MSTEAQIYVIKVGCSSAVFLKKLFLYCTLLHAEKCLHVFLDFLVSVAVFALEYLLFENFIFFVVTFKVSNFFW